MVREDIPANNYGSDTYMHVSSQNVNRNYRSFLEFNLSPIPAAATIISATLRVVCYAVNNLLANVSDVEACRVADDGWDEGTLTWANQKALGAVEDTQTPSVATIEWDVTAWVENEWAGDKLVSICLKSETESYDATIRRSSYKTKEDVAPELVVVYSVPSHKCGRLLTGF